jgi:hypothetical protein
MSAASNLIVVLPAPEESPSPDVRAVPTEGDLETLDAAIAAINSELAAACHLSLDLRDQRERLLTRRAEILLRRERTGLFAAGELVTFYGIEHVGPVDGEEGQ